jgi:hypothetical protein
MGVEDLVPLGKNREQRSEEGVTRLDVGAR